MNAWRRRAARAHAEGTGPAAGGAVTLAATARAAPTRFATVLAMAGAVTLASAAALDAQSLADRIGAIDDGTVVFRFEARPDVYGDGSGAIRFSDDEYVNARRPVRRDRSTAWHNGPVRVAVHVRAGRTARLRTTVGPEPARPDSGPVTDLGTVRPVDAVDYLLALAGSADDGDLGSDALLPATLADGVEIWPTLLELAREARRPRETREAATFWLSRAAADAVTDELGAIAEDDSVDLEVRKHAVFALSRRPREQAVPELIRVVRSETLHAEIRSAALFWLGRTDDPRALAIFEEILLGSG